MYISNIIRLITEVGEGRLRVDSREITANFISKVNKQLI